jgi:hypothetical protein
MTRKRERDRTKPDIPPAKDPLHNPGLNLPEYRHRKWGLVKLVGPGGEPVEDWRPGRMDECAHPDRSNGGL